MYEGGGSMKVKMAVNTLQSPFSMLLKFELIDIGDIV